MCVLFSTCVLSTEAVCLSHMGLISIPLSLSRSPWWKNSSMILSVHWRYRSRGLVGLLRSAQWTMLRKTCGEKIKIKIIILQLYRVCQFQQSVCAGVWLLPASCQRSCPTAELQSWSLSWFPPSSSDQPADSCVWTCQWPKPKQRERKQAHPQHQDHLDRLWFQTRSGYKRKEWEAE